MNVCKETTGHVVRNLRELFNYPLTILLKQEQEHILFKNIFFLFTIMTLQLWLSTQCVALKGYQLTACTQCTTCWGACTPLSQSVKVLKMPPQHKLTGAHYGRQGKSLMGCVDCLCLSDCQCCCFSHCMEMLISCEHLKRGCRLVILA